jgi:hypothetical protein
VSESLLFFDSIFTESTLAQDEGRKLEVVRNVLLAGNVSKNGYTIPASAFGSTERVKALYDGAPVHLDHDLEKGPSRSVGSLAGTVVNARLVEGKPRADILLNGNAAGDDLRAIVKLAQKSNGKLRNVGISHVASYKFAPGRKTVERVEAVYSCDLVIGPATTRNLFEGTQPVPFNPSQALDNLAAGREYNDSQDELTYRVEFLASGRDPQGRFGRATPAVDFDALLGGWAGTGFDPRTALDELTRTR